MTMFRVHADNYPAADIDADIDAASSEDARKAFTKTRPGARVTKIKKVRG